MAAYDREFTTAVHRQARLRVGYTTERGVVRRYVVQLEYRLDDDWLPVVRYDHDEDGAHDVSRSGLHRDVYRDGEKAWADTLTGPISAEDGFEVAEADLRENLERFIERFERWHEPDARGR